MEILHFKLFPQKWKIMCAFTAKTIIVYSENGNLLHVVAHPDVRTEPSVLSSSLRMCCSLFTLKMSGVSSENRKFTVNQPSLIMNVTAFFMSLKVFVFNSQ